jgi:hypothetical protein
MKVRARRGSQTWYSPPHASQGRALRTSTTSHRWSKPSLSGVDPDGLGDEAVGAVAADEEAPGEGAARGGGGVGVDDLGADPSGVLGDGLDEDATVELDGRQRGHPLAEERLERRLVEHVRLGQSRRGGRGPLELRQQGVVLVEEPHAEAGLGDGREALADAEAVEDAVDLVVEVDGPRQRVDAVVPLENGDAEAALPEEDGEGEAGRAGAHDHDVVGVVHARPPPRTAVRCVPRSRPVASSTMRAVTTSPSRR